MSALTDDKLRQLPKPIVDKLRSLIGRARRLMFIRGLFATLAVALVCILVIMGIDAAVTLFSDTLRWVLSLTGLAITCLAGWQFMVRPLSRRLGLTRIARVIETRHPELQERISTAVELMSSDDPDSIRGSQELIEEVVNSAVIDVDAVDPEAEFKPARSRRPMIVVGAIAALIALLFAVFPHHIGVLFARAVAPFLDIGNAYADTLSVNPGDVRVAIGDPVTVEISIQNEKIRRAELRRSTVTPEGDATSPGKRGEESVERMTLLEERDDGTQVYRMTFPSVQESFDYRIRAGAAVSEYFTVTAVPTPRVEELTIGYDFPAYTRLPDKQAVSETGDIRAVAHTRVAVTAQINKEVTAARLIIGDSDEAVAEATITGDQLRWEFDLAPETNAMWRIDLDDADGFSNVPLNYQVVALADATPKVDIVAPEARQLKLKPTEFLPIFYLVEEDFGFSEVQLFVKPNQTSKTWNLLQATPESADTPASESRLGDLWANVRKFLAPGARDGGQGAWRGDAPLDLSGLDLEGISQLTVRVVVQDNLPEEYGGPNIGYSEAIVINLDLKAESLVRQTVDNQLKELQQAIKESRQEVDKARNEAREAERQLAREDQVNAEAQKDLDDLRDHAKQADEKMREVAERMKQTAFNQQAEDLEQIADEEIAAAQESADMIPVTDDQKERVAEARNAREQLDQAAKELQEIEKSLADAREDAQLVAELSELANEQRQLAQDAAQQAQQQQQQQAQQQQQDPRQAQQQQQELAEWQREQQQVQRELGEVLRDNEAALREVLEDRQEQATELSEQARELAQEQQTMRELTELASKAEDQQSLQEQLVGRLQQEQQAIAEATRELQQQQQEQTQQGQSSQEQTQEQAPSSPRDNQTSANDSAMAQQEDPAQDPAQAQAAAETTPAEGNTAQTQASAEPGNPEPAMSPSESEPAATNEGAEPGAPEDAQASDSKAALAEAAQQTEQAAQQLAQEELAAAAESAQQAQAQLSEAQQSAAAEAAATAAESQEPAQAQAQAASSSEQAATSAETSEDADGTEGTPPAPSPTPAAADGSTPPADSAPAMAQAADEGAPSSASEAEAAATAAATAEQLGQLAERQQQVATQLEAIAGGQLDEALAEMEAQLADDAAELAQQSEALENAAQMAQANARTPASQATDRLEGGQRSADQASQQLSQAQQAQNQAAQQGQPAGQPSQQEQQQLAQSQRGQQSAQQQFDQAARALEQAAKSLAQQAKGLSSEEMDSPFLDSQDLSQSFQDVSDAATAPTSEQAAQQAQQAAQSLQQMAQAAMQQLGAMGNQPPPQQPGDPSQQGQPGQDKAPPGMADAGSPQLGDDERNPDADGSGVPPELQALGISIEDWAQLKGTLQSGRDSTGASTTPAEYRDLVNRYFRVIANEAAEKR